VFKTLVTALIVATALVPVEVSSALSSSAHPDIYVYVPKPDIQQVPQDNIKVLPKPADKPDGVGQWCDTLRGKGLVLVAVDGRYIFIVIDCPEQKMKDL
jgi:hypothetical protein